MMMAEAVLNPMELMVGVGEKSHFACFLVFNRNQRILKKCSGNYMEQKQRFVAQKG